MNQRKKVTLTLSLALLLLGAISQTFSYFNTKNHMSMMENEAMEKTWFYFQEELHDEVEIMHGIFLAVEKNKEIRQAWLKKDRQELLNLTKQIFAEIREEFEITHFYFHQTDKVNFLRVHNPPRYGDFIDRYTMKQAAENTLDSMKKYNPAHGIELGIWGTFALRFVHPWYIDGQLVGYIELGQEIDKTLTRVSVLHGIGLLILIDKNLINQGKWFEGMSKILHREENQLLELWQRYDKHVLMSQTISEVPAELGRLLDKGHEGMAGNMYKSKNYLIGLTPLFDAMGKEVGEIVILQPPLAYVSRSKIVFQVQLAVSLLVLIILITYVGNVISKLVTNIRQEAQERKLIAEDLEKTNKKLLEDIDKREEAEKSLFIKHQNEQVFNKLLSLSFKEIPLDEILRKFIHYTTSLPWLSIAAKGVVFLVEDESEVLTMKAQKGLNEHLLTTCDRLPFGKCLCGRAASSGKIVFAAHIDERHDVLFDGILPHGHYCVPIVSPEGKLLGVFTVYTEDGTAWNESTENFLHSAAHLLALIIHRRMIESQTKEAKLVAEEASQAKSLFLANMSHEIRTPMNGIVGMTHLLKSTELTAKQRDYLSKISSSTKNLLSIINDILDFSKIEAEKLVLESIDFCLEDVLAHAVNSISLKAKKKGLDFNLSVSEDVPLNCTGDPLRLGQILVNLANNALKFTETGSIEINTSLEEQVNDNVKLRFSITDTGCGLSEQQRAKLFKAFSQADSTTTRMYGGTGLGLALSLRLAKMMDGDIEVKSELGCGSTFSLLVVLGIQQAGLQTEFMPPPELCGLKALVVDDSATILHIMNNALRSFSFDVTGFSSGEKAVEEVEKAGLDNPYKLLILDWKLTGINGIETARRIKAIYGPSHPVVSILATGYDNDELLEEAEKAGFDEIILKPVVRAVLFDTIMASFNKKEGEEHNNQPGNTMDESLRMVMGAKVLVVEDNEINQQIAVELLESMGIVADIANNGQEGVEAVLQKKYDMVLMDIQMPVMDGLEATSRIRANGAESAELPIVAMTAHAMAGDRKKSIVAGMNDHITKPIDPQELQDRLIRWIKPGQREIPAELSSCLEKNNQQEEITLPELPGIIVEDGLVKMAGNAKKYKNLLIKFSNNHANDVSEIKDLFANNDSYEARRLTHTLKGVSGNIGAMDLHHASFELEKLIKEEGDRSEVEQQLSVVEGCLQQVINSIEILKIDQGPGQEEDDNFDLNSLQPDLKVLAILIRENDTAAGNMVGKIQEKSNKLAKMANFQNLVSSINSYDFDKALEKLEEIAQEMNFNLEGEE